MATKKPGSVFVILLLGALDTIAPLTIDMYLPAFTRMAADFRTTTATVSLSLTSYFVGLGIGQLFYGPFMDRFGRHRPLYAGMFLYVGACIGCALANTIEQLIMFRFIQALGGSASAVAVRAMVRDYFTVDESPKIFSMLMLILSVSPLFAPSIGGVITNYLEWQWIFYILSGIVVLIVGVMFFFLPDNHQRDKSVSLRIQPMFETFSEILKNRQFTGYTISTSFSLGGLFLYLAGSTVILQEKFQVSPQFYAILFALQSVGLILGNQLNLILLKRYPAKSIFRLALAIQFVSSIAFLAGSFVDFYGVYATVGFFFILLMCLGMTFPNGSALALAPLSKNLGSASSLMGFLQICIGGLISAGVGLFDAKDSLPIAAMLFVSSACAFISVSLGPTAKPSMTN